MEAGCLVDDAEGDENVVSLDELSDLRSVNFEEEHEGFSLEVLWIQSR